MGNIAVNSLTHSFHPCYKFYKKFVPSKGLKKENSSNSYKYLLKELQRSKNPTKYFQKKIPKPKNSENKFSTKKHTTIFYHLKDI